MRIEKLNDNKVKITLSIDELKERSIDVKELKKDTVHAQEILWDLITEAQIDRDFEIDESQILVEAYTSTDSSFVVTITRLNNCDTSVTDMYHKIDFKHGNTPSKKLKATSHSSCFVFDNLEKAISACKIITNTNLYIGKNSLYYYNNKYFLCFSKYTTKLLKSKPMFSVLSEYGEAPKYMELFETLLKEKGDLVYESKAITELSKY